MLSKSRHWVLRFDGSAFCLESDSKAANAPARNRVLEEGLETILFHWGNELLPAPRLRMLARSGAITREQDLLAVDELGRIHIFELKKDRADAQSMFQLVSYLASRPQDDEEWVRRSIANTLWYGESYAACRLAGLVSRQSVEKLRTDKSRKVVGKRVPYVELLEARINKLTELASERTQLDLKAEAFSRIARSLIEQDFGGHWDGPLEDPTKVLDVVAGARLPSHWRVGRTRPHIIIWMVAPSIAQAADAAHPLMERGLEIRSLSVDVREVVPGKEWGIAVSGPESEMQGWSMADSFAALMSSIAAKHVEAYSTGAERMYLYLPSTTASWAEKGWAELGWRAAGGASVLFYVRGNQISHDLFTNNWTQGTALAIRGPLQRLYKQVRASHPKAWSWSAQDPGATCNQEFVDGATRLVNDFWRGLERIGAFDIDPWGYWMPEEFSVE